MGVETAGFPSPEEVGPRSTRQLAAGDPCMSCPFFHEGTSWRARFRCRRVARLETDDGFFFPVPLHRPVMK